MTEESIRESTREDIKERLRAGLPALTAIDGVSGHEEDVVRHLRDAIAPLVDRIEVDSIGNLYATREGGDAPHLMLAAHSDEIGGLVSAIESGGFLRFQLVGGASEALLIGRKVRIRGQRGIVGVRPGHLTPASEARTVPEIEQLFIDLGMESAEEVHALGIRPGDGVVWQSELQPLANPNRLAGKAVDNRISCLILIELLRDIMEHELPGKLTVVIAVQEEVGLKGARIAAERIRPDRAVVIDTVPCADTPDSGGRRVTTFPVKLGAGPVFQVSSGPKAGGFILPDSIREYLIRVSEEAGIPYQLATFAYGNTDAAAVYSSAGGIPTAAVTIPRRYSHSPVEVLDLNDAVATFELCRMIVERASEFPGGLVSRLS